MPFDVIKAISGLYKGPSSKIIVPEIPKDVIVQIKSPILSQTDQKKPNKKQMKAETVGEKISQIDDIVDDIMEPDRKKRKTRKEIQRDVIDFLKQNYRDVEEDTPNV